MITAYKPTETCRIQDSPILAPYSPNNFLLGKPILGKDRHGHCDLSEQRLSP